MQKQKSNDVRKFLIKLKDKERVSRIYLLKKFKINPKFLDEILKNYLADDILRKEKEGREVAYIMSREKLKEGIELAKEKASATEKKLYKWDGRIFKKGKECPVYTDMVGKREAILCYLVGNAIKELQQNKVIYEYNISDVAKKLKCTERAIYKAISSFAWIDSKKVVIPSEIWEVFKNNKERKPININQFLI